MFPQDPCIIYIEKECKVQVSVWGCAHIAGLPLTFHCAASLGGEPLKLSPKMPSRARESQSRGGINIGGVTSMSGIKQFQCLGLVVLNLDRVTE